MTPKIKVAVFITSNKPHLQSRMTVIGPGGVEEDVFCTGGLVQEALRVAHVVRDELIGIQYDWDSGVCIRVSVTYHV